MENGNHTNWLLAAIGALTGVVGILWRKLNRTEKSLESEKAARLIDKERAIRRLEELQKEAEKAGRTPKAKRRRREGRV